MPFIFADPEKKKEPLPKVRQQWIRHAGSKEKIGIILSTTDGSEFSITEATITVRELRQAKKYTKLDEKFGLLFAPLSRSNLVCTFSSGLQRQHKIEFVWQSPEHIFSKKGYDKYIATFNVHLQDGQILVRHIGIQVVP